MSDADLAELQRVAFERGYIQAFADIALRVDIEKTQATDVVTMAAIHAIQNYPTEGTTDAQALSV